MRYAVVVRRAAVLPAEQVSIPLSEADQAVPPPSMGGVAARPGPNGCTGKPGGACKGRAGPDRRCAAHKER